MENIVIKLQKRYLLNKFNRILFDCNTLFNTLSQYLTQPKYINYWHSEKQNNDRYKELQKILVNSNNLKLIEKLLNHLYRYCNQLPKITPRFFLIAWMIVSYPECTINLKRPIENTKAYPNDIYFISNNFIESLSQNSPKNPKTKEDLRKFKKSFTIYSNAITYFIKRNKFEQINMLIDEYVSIHDTISEIQKSTKYNEQEREQSISIIKTTKTKISKQLKQFDSTIELAELEVRCNIHDVIKTNLETAMYDILIKDLNNKKFSYFSNLINDITKKLLKLGAHKIDISFVDNINPDNIIKCLTYLHININDVIQYGDYIINIINKLEGRIDVNETNLLWDNIKTQSDDVINLLASLVIFLLKKINDIIETITNLKEVYQSRK